MRRWLLGAIIVMATVVSGCGTLVIRTTPSYGYYPNYDTPPVITLPSFRDGTGIVIITKEDDGTAIAIITEHRPPFSKMKTGRFFAYFSALMAFRIFSTFLMLSISRTETAMAFGRIFLSVFNFSTSDSSSTRSLLVRKRYSGFLRSAAL